MSRVSSCAIARNPEKNCRQRWSTADGCRSADVDQLVVHRHYTRSPAGLVSNARDSGVTMRMVVMGGESVRVAVVGQVLEDNRGALGRHPAEHPALPLACVGERANRKRCDVGEVVVVVKPQIRGFDGGDVDGAFIGERRVAGQRQQQAQFFEEMFLWNLLRLAYKVASKNKPPKMPAFVFFLFRALGYPLSFLLLAYAVCLHIVDAVIMHAVMHKFCMSRRVHSTYHRDGHAECRPCGQRHNRRSPNSCLHAASCMPRCVHSACLCGLLHGVNAVFDDVHAAFYISSSYHYAGVNTATGMV